VATTDDLLAYARKKNGHGFLVVLNLGSESRTFGDADGRLVLSTHLDREGEPAKGGIELRAGEGVIVEQT
jgi:alpha-glucosidase